MRGGIILGLRFDGDASGVDLRVEISGSVRADDVLVANEAPGGAGGSAAFLASSLGNSARVTLTPTGTLTLIGDKRGRARRLVEEGTLAASVPGGPLEIAYNGANTVVTASPPEPE